MSDRMSGGATPTRPSRALVLSAFLAIYVVWGSTYLAIRYAVETLPPFLMTGARFMLAGAVLYALARLRGVPPATRVEWRAAIIAGALLLVGGTATVGWAEQWIPSGLASLILAAAPLWMVLLDWSLPNGVRPSWRVASGVALGLTGLAVLLWPELSRGGTGASPGPVLVLLLGGFLWAAGSLYSRRAAAPSSALLHMGMQMLAGGALSAGFGLALGEGGRLGGVSVSLASAIAFVYLLLFGSLIGFSAYLWLMRVSTPARVATHAYVNPLVAVLLGWAVAGEEVGARALAAAAIILAAVVLITLEPARKAERTQRRERRVRRTTRPVSTREAVR